MHFSLAFAVAFVAGILPAQAQTHFGCWSEKSTIFHEDCLTAATALVTELLITPHGTKVVVPSSLETFTRGSCRVQMKGKGTRRVAVSALLSSIDQLVRRCQHGWFYYGNDGWLNFNIQGRAGWKRNADANADAVDELDVDFPHGGPIQWKTLESPDSLNLPAATPLDSINTKRQHAKGLVVRAPPDGPYPSGLRLTGLTSGGFHYSLYRTAQYSMSGLVRIAPQLTEFFSRTVSDMVSDALVENNAAIQIASIANNDGRLSHAIGLVAKFGHGPRTWQALFNRWGDGGFATNELMADALDNFYREGFTSAVYHIWNEKRKHYISFTINRVVGTNDPFPRTA